MQSLHSFFARKSSSNRRYILKVILKFNMAISKVIRETAQRLYKNGEGLREIGRILMIAPNSVRNIVMGRHKKQKERRGPKPKLSRSDLTAIKRTTTSLTDEGRQVTAREVMNTSNIEHVSAWTMRRAMSRLGLKYQKVKKNIVLTKEHKKRRLELATKWIDEMWPWFKVIWSDEKRFNLDGPDSWGSWQREDQKIQRNKRQQGGQSIQFWGMLLPDGKLILKELSQWSKSEDYIGLLAGFAWPIIELEYGGDFIFQQDNASIHVSKETMDFFQRHKIQVMDWPARSPDLSPIENVWSLLTQEIYKGPQFNNVQELREAIINAVEVLNMTQRHKMKKIRDSIASRLRQVVQVKGDKIKY